jgi:hypothetical protein
MLKRTREENEELRLLSKRGVFGNTIPEHRALLSLSFSLFRIMTIFLLPAAFDIALRHSFDVISQVWVMFFRFWFEKLGIPGKVLLTSSEMGWMTITHPVFDMPSSTPDGFTWWAVVATTVFLLMLSLILPQRLMPLTYFIRFAAAIQISALAFFAVMPAEFPYSISSYLENLLISGVWLMFVLPWVHALIYYIFDFSVTKKLGLTLVTLVFIATALPFQVMVHAILLLKFSLLILPLLYILFGLFLLILACIALYGWAMSWQKA